MNYAIRVLAFISVFLFVSSVSQAQFAVLRTLSGTDGAYPYAAPVVYNGVAYGTAGMMIYRMSVDGSNYRILHTFTGGADGGGTTTGLTRSGTMLYGVTFNGGASNLGVVFRIKIDGSGFAVLHYFGGADGSTPSGKLCVSVVNTVQYLYGTTFGGGASDTGVIYRLAADGSGYAVVYNFGTGRGKNPYGGVIHISGYLYGTTSDETGDGFGIIYRIRDTGVGFTVLHYLALLDGTRPLMGSLVSDGTFLYGTCLYGGAGGYGTIFKISKWKCNSFMVIHDFDLAEGAYPYNELTLSGLTLYGTAHEGGAHNCGTIFRLATNGSDFVTLHYMDPATDGVLPACGLYLASGILYGANVFGGAHDVGTLFKVTP